MDRYPLITNGEKIYIEIDEKKGTLGIVLESDGYAIKVLQVTAHATTDEAGVLDIDDWWGWGE